MRGRVLLAGLASTAVVAGCAPAPSDPEPAGPLLAFRAATEIGLVQDGVEVASAPGDFAPTGEPILTEDSRFVFARDDRGLAVLDTESRASRDIAAPVGAAVGTGGESTVVWVDGNRLMQLDLAVAAPVPSLRRTLDLPPGDAVLIAARRDTAVVAVGNGPQTLYALTAAAPPRPLGNTGANTPVELAVVSPDGRSVAYAVYRGSDLACGRAALTIVSLADAAPRTLNVGPRDDGTATQVLNLWWTGITPELSATSWNCADPAIAKLPAVSEVRGLALDPAAGDASLWTVDLGQGTTARLMPSAATPRERSGILVVDIRGEQKGAAAGVNAIAAVS